MKVLDIICPCYNEENSLEKFYMEVSKAFGNVGDVQWKIFFVNDGSSDDTLSHIKKLAEKHDNISFISFSRNFGKEAAIFAGLNYSNGDYTVLMDADLQDPPYLLPKMIEAIEEGYDIVSTRRVSRKGEPVIRSFFARLFYRVVNKISKVNIADGARDYKLITAQVRDSILELKEYNRFSKGIFSWVGFENKWIEYENIERAKGESSWSFFQLFKYSIEGIVSFTTAPLHIATIIGIIFSIIAFIAIIFIVAKTLIFGEHVDGWPSTVSIILFVGGVQLFAIGIVGQYLAKVYSETKNRPIYIIKEKDV